jgi:hypothetical protein
MPQDQILFTFVTEKDTDGHGVIHGELSLTQSPFTGTQGPQHQEYGPSWTKRALPPIDLITAFQRLLI